MFGDVLRCGIWRSRTNEDYVVFSCEPCPVSLFDDPIATGAGWWYNKNVLAERQRRPGPGSRWWPLESGRSGASLTDRRGEAFVPLKAGPSSRSGRGLRALAMTIPGPSEAVPFCAKGAASLFFPRLLQTLRACFKSVYLRPRRSCTSFFKGNNNCLEPILARKIAFRDLRGLKSSQVWTFKAPS